MRGTVLSLPTKLKLEQVYPIAKSCGTVSTTTPKKLENIDSKGGIVNGPFVALSLLETLYSRDGDDNVNTRGAFLCCKEAANRLKHGGGGRIILITSSQVGGLKPGYGAYAASKAAAETMVKILAKELKGTSITANCVAPGAVATEMFFEGKTKEMIQGAIDVCPLGRLGETKDVVPVVGFLASDASEWINGQVIRVNGGYV